MAKRKFCILGGDYRFYHLYKLLKADGNTVSIFDNSYHKSESDILEAISDSSMIILPIPFTADNININLTNYKIGIDELLSIMSRAGAKQLIGGVINNEIRHLGEKYNINVYDFFSFECVAVKNAIPTAEGAVMIAMQKSEKTIFGSSCLVIGYGRCGKILASTLKGLGASVSVTARNEETAAYISAYGLNPVFIDKLSGCIMNYDYIFNTAPSKVLNKEMLKRIAQESVIIDLAQAPGGVDYEYARELGLNATYCPGLPGRVAPYTAAEILKEAILNICDCCNNCLEK